MPWNWLQGGPQILTFLVKLGAFHFHRLDPSMLAWLKSKSLTSWRSVNQAGCVVCWRQRRESQPCSLCTLVIWRIPFSLLAKKQTWRRSLVGTGETGKNEWRVAGGNQHLGASTLVSLFPGCEWTALFQSLESPQVHLALVVNGNKSFLFVPFQCTFKKMLHSVVVFAFAETVFTFFFFFLISGWLFRTCANMTSCNDVVPSVSSFSWWHLQIQIS